MLRPGANRSPRAIARIGATLAFLWSVGAADVLAGVLCVPDDYPTIQAAVDAASPGDVIRVRPGMYPEQVTIRQSSIRLEADPVLSAILDGGTKTDTRPAISIQGTADRHVTRVSVVGFDIRNYLGSGISLLFADQCEILSNGMDHVGAQGIAVSRSTFNRIAENTLSNATIGVLVSTVSRDNTVKENTISGSFVHGIRVSMINGTPLRNRIVENVICTQGAQGGISIAGFASANTIKENRIAGEGAAGIILEASTSGNMVKENTVNGASIDIEDLSRGNNIVIENLHDPTLACPGSVSSASRSTSRLHSLSYMIPNVRPLFALAAR